MLCILFQFCISILFVFCTCADTALCMLLSFSQLCPSCQSASQPIVFLYFCILYLFVTLILFTLSKLPASPPGTGRLSKHLSAKCCYDDRTKGTTMTTTMMMMKMQKNAFDGRQCAPNKRFDYFVGLSGNLKASANLNWNE